jgi:hypothetical protein
VKSKSNDEVLNALKAIYKRGILKMPKLLEVDAGTEFKGSVAKYLNYHGVNVRIANPGRHRQQAMVERRNQIIGTAIFKRQVAEELTTNAPAKDWVEDLPELITQMNKKTKKTKFPKAKTDAVCKGDSCDLLDIGQQVRVALEYPKDVATGAKLPGKFRSVDIRWDVTPRTIKEILIKPGFPPMYLLDGEVGKRKVEPVAYTKNQLQFIPKNEQKPDRSVVRNEKFEVEEILDKKRSSNKVYYKVRWKSYPLSAATWEPASDLKKQVPDLIKAFELRKA